MTGEKHVRRVVTGHNAEANAVVLMDEVMTGRPIGEGRAVFAKVWTTATSPADNDDARDGAERESGLTVEGGTVLRYVDFAPGSRSPMHRTNSLDYGIVLRGHLVMELDSGEHVELSPEDVVVQRGTIHAWVNASSDWARMAFVLVDAKPATVNGVQLDPESRD